jgi:hypothetical protein
MARVVIAVEVPSVPAGREKSLGSQTTARQAGKVRGFSSVGAFKARVGDGSLCRV